MEIIKIIGLLIMFYTIYLGAKYRNHLITSLCLSFSTFLLMFGSLLKMDYTNTFAWLVLFVGDSFVFYMEYKKVRRKK